MKLNHRKSKNVETGEKLPLADFLKLEQGEIKELSKETPPMSKKAQENAFRTGRRLGMGKALEAIEHGTFGKNSATELKGPRFPKANPNPFAKAKGN